MWRQHTCYFSANGSMNPDVFSLNPSQSQRESSLKIPVAGIRRFGGVREHPNRLTHSQTGALIERLESLDIRCILKAVDCNGDHLRQCDGF